MASSVQLRLKFGTMNGEKTWTFKNVLASPSVAAVKTLTEVMIANGSVYKYPPLAVSKATLVQTQETDYDLDE